MAFSLRNIPIKRKLMLVILLTSGFAILLMGSALITYELVTFRSALTNNIEVLAQIIGSKMQFRFIHTNPIPMTTGSKWHKVATGSCVRKGFDGNMSSVEQH